MHAFSVETNQLWFRFSLSNPRPLWRSFARRGTNCKPEDPMTTRFGGYCVVIKRASDYFIAFETYTIRHCADVEELPVGTRVLVLPLEDADVAWAPVVVDDDHYGARFTWHHPECIRLFPLSELGGCVTVGHTRQRNRNAPSHIIATYGTGVYDVSSAGCPRDLVLDARWEEVDTRTRITNFCTGWCACVCVETASLPNRVADIMWFASYCDSGSVVCRFGKHRSLSAARILPCLTSRCRSLQSILPFSAHILEL